jgi:hypothetical protein
VKAIRKSLAARRVARRRQGGGNSPVARTGTEVPEQQQ